MYSMKRTSAPIAAGVLDQRHELVVVDAADDDRVDLETTRSRPRRGRDPGEHACSSSKRVSAWKRSRLERVEADRDAVQAGRSKRMRHCEASSTPLVVSARSAIAGRAASDSTSTGKVAAEQRLAAGEPHAVDAERRERVDDRARSPRTCSRLSRGSHT